MLDATGIEYRVVDRHHRQKPLMFDDDARAVLDTAPMALLDLDLRDEDWIGHPID